MDLVELKNSICEMQISPDGINSRLDSTEEQISELVNIGMDTIHTKAQKERRKKPTSGAAG